MARQSGEGESAPLDRAKEGLKRVLMDPKRLIQGLIRRSRRAPYAKKVFWDAVDRPHFAYCLYQAAYQARALGIDAISAVEFGVAGGNGLVALERVANDVERSLEVRVDVFGFDAGEGMPEPLDYRDLPYLWRAGDFKMDLQKLKGRLTSAELVLGDVAETVPTFFEQYSPPPLGFISFDLDYYSSTVAALGIFDGGFEHYLPRVFCFMDDVVGSDIEIHCEFVGELLAIEEFNAAREDRKLARINGLEWKRPIPAQWNSQIWALHLFRHPLYGQHVPQPRRDIFDFDLD